MISGRVIPPAGRHDRQIPRDVCCNAMSAHLSQPCGQHADPFDCSDNIMYWAPPFDEYGLIIHDGGRSYIVVEYCPWCGKRLPPSKRDRWFQELEALGVDSPLVDNIPSRYESDAWYRKSS
jgi:hypothetical protein